MLKAIRVGEPGYRRCSVTVMDTTDPEITFNEAGECNYVTRFQEIRKRWNPDGDPRKLSQLMDRIRMDGRGKQYDCILGLSGGVDSSYTAYIAWKFGLRPLIVHTDTGWNSEIAVSNIELLVKNFKFDLVTFVVDWHEMLDLQRAFLKAGVPNQDIPQDHAIFAAFYRTAVKHRITWVLSGRNYATESVLPRSWGYDAGDLRHLHDIHRRFGERRLRAFPRLGYLRNAIELRLLHRMKFARPLDLVAYNRSAAIETLSEECGWRNYGAKHYESRFTKFFQGWYLPSRFGYDKRLAHYSSMILSDQMSRAEALAALSTPAYSEHELQSDKQFIQKKLGFSEREFADLLNAPTRGHDYYRSSAQAIRMALQVRNRARGLVRGHSL